MIYMLKSGEYIKIGYTQSLKTFPKRMESYFTHNPDVEFIGYKEGDKQLEKEFHNDLSKYKIDSAVEWFKVPDDIFTKLLNIFNPEGKTYIIIGFRKNDSIEEKNLSDCFEEVHKYTLEYFINNVKDFYSSEELKKLIIDINSKFNIRLNIRPASVGLIVSIKKTTMRIPITKGGGTKTMYKYCGKDPNYHYT